MPPAVSEDGKTTLAAFLIIYNVALVRYSSTSPAEAAAHVAASYAILLSSHVTHLMSLMSQ